MNTKRLRLIISLMLIAITNIFTQQGELGWGEGEIYVGTRGIVDGVSYKMKSIGSLYGGGPFTNPPSNYILNPEQPDYVFATATRYDQVYFYNTVFSSYNWPYFRIIQFSDPLFINGFGYGLYKFYIEEEVPIANYSANFYIDYRDCNYGNYSGPHSNDLWIKWEKNLDMFFYMPEDNDANNPDDENWIPITNGSLLYFYEIKSQPFPCVNQFPNYWQNCLILTESGQNPRLVWGPYPNNPPLQGTITGYKVYRSATHNGGEPPTNFSYLATVG
jgi:hypothetical protein